MLKTIIKSLCVLTICTLFVLPDANAKEINIFDGLIKIKTYDDSDRDDSPRHNHYREDGHYEIIDGRLVWIPDNKHIIDHGPKNWVLLTRIENSKFSWVVIEEREHRKIRNYLKRGYHRSMTGSKKTCKRMGRKKERLWEKYHSYWQ